MNYRLYIIGEDGHIERRVDLEADDDPSAIEKAQQFVDGKDLELWHRDGLIRKLPRKTE